MVNVKATCEGTSWWAQSVKKCVYSDYVHTDRLGSVVNLTDQYGRVPAQIDYDDWGKVTAYQSLNISGGYRTVLPEITYAGHQYDDVLGMYYAKARMYDAENRRFAAMDPVKGRITEPMSMVQYLYVLDNPLRWVDLLGLRVPADDAPGGAITKLYINGQLYTNVAKIYNNRTWIKASMIDTVERAAELKSGIIGYESIVDSVTKPALNSGVDAVTGAAPSVSSITKNGYYQQGKSKIYFTRFECEDYIMLNSLAEINGLQDTLSWWVENGITNVTFNSMMKDSPVSLIRQGNQVYITVYAEFFGNYDTSYYNSLEAVHRLMEMGKNDEVANFNSSLYHHPYSYADLIAQGVKENWSVTRNANQYSNQPHLPIPAPPRFLTP